MLFAFLVIVAYINTRTNEFDARVQAEIERLHRQIDAEEYEEIYRQSGKKLITSFGEQEFANILRTARPFIAGKFTKSCRTEYADMVERLKRNLGLTFQLETVCSVEGEQGKSYQYFDWRITGDNIKLIWFENALRK